MASLSEIYVKKETLKTILDILDKKGEQGVKLTLSIDDKSKEFTTKEGKTIYQNVSAYVSQTKEQREEKKQRFYVGNGGCYWTDGVIKTAGEAAPAQAAAIPDGIVSSPADDLPF